MQLRRFSSPLRVGSRVQNSVGNYKKRRGGLIAVPSEQGQPVVGQWFEFTRRHQDNSSAQPKVVGAAESRNPCPSQMFKPRNAYRGSICPKLFVRSPAREQFWFSR
jgi:hypothetical protein